MTFVNRGDRYHKPDWPKLGEIGRANKSRPREPLRTFSEMAEEFGVKPAALRAVMRWAKTEPPPKPLGMNVSMVGPSNTYYQPSALRAWWKAECAARTAKP